MTAFISTLTALDIWEGFFRIMMANGSLLLMAACLDGIPGGFSKVHT